MRAFFFGLYLFIVRRRREKTRTSCLSQEPQLEAELETQALNRGPLALQYGRCPTHGATLLRALVGGLKAGSSEESSGSISVEYSSASCQCEVSCPDRTRPRVGLADSTDPIPAASLLSGRLTLWLGRSWANPSLPSVLGGGGRLCGPPASCGLRGRSWSWCPLLLAPMLSPGQGPRASQPMTHRLGKDSACPSSLRLDRRRTNTQDPERRRRLPHCSGQVQRRAQSHHQRS